MNIKESSNSTEGFESGISFEQISLNDKWGYGSSLAFIRVTGKVANANAITKIIPFTLQGKYLFGNSGAKGFILATWH